MADTILRSIFTGDLNVSLVINWLNNESIEDIPEDCILLCCSRTDFAAYFLSFLRRETDSILQTNSSAFQLLQNQNTPEKLLSTRKHNLSISDPTNDSDKKENSQSTLDDHRSHESFSRINRSQVKTKLFQDDKSKEHTMSSNESQTSMRVDKLMLSSTPVQNSVKHEKPIILSPITSDCRSGDRCDTPRLGRQSRSHEKGISFGDYIVHAQKSTKKKKNGRKGKNVSSEQEDSKVEFNLSNSESSPETSAKRNIKPANVGSNVSNTSVNDSGCFQQSSPLVLQKNVAYKQKKLKPKELAQSFETERKNSRVEFNLSNSETFPEIGAKSSAKRRIKPININSNVSIKEASSNGSGCFRQLSPLVVQSNVAFKQQVLQPKELANSFEIERKMLKLEKDNLIEKFSSPMIQTPKKSQITHIMPKDSPIKQKKFIQADLHKVCFKNVIETLVEVYEALIRSNFILSSMTELYFLISILLSKQSEDELVEINESNCPENLLRTIHNSTYFAVKALWTQRNILDVILDKNALKVLGENKTIRSFCPDLAKYLLNSYGLKCEEEIKNDQPQQVQENNLSGGVTRFNFETDNIENFPTMTNFQNFKKQRDMFHEIYRAYTESYPAKLTSFRSRIKTLLSFGTSATNHAHLATLFVGHMCLECLPSGQESKLSKLHRRFTSPAPPESHRLPHFTAKEEFYKNFLMYAENDSFRLHVQDALATEIILLDSTLNPNEERNSNVDITRDFLQVSRKLQMLSKFLGFLNSLPYCFIPHDTPATAECSLSTKSHLAQLYAVPKEKVLERNITLRNYKQPTIDLMRILKNADERGQLSVTVPWIVQYLSFVDYSSLRIKCYQDIIKYLLDIYRNKLIFSTSSKFKKCTVIFLKSTLGWLFDLPHFPHELFDEKCRYFTTENLETCVDYYQLLDEPMLLELSPSLKDISTLLLTSRVSSDQKDVSRFRHITPVSFDLNPEERIRNKEKEIQARLEEELLKSQPSTTRRVMEMVTERITSACLRSLTTTVLPAERDRAVRHVRAEVQARKDDSELLSRLQSLYANHLKQLRSKSLKTATAYVKERASNALNALLPYAPKPLQAIVTRNCLSKINKWINTNWNSTAIFCKDIKSEMEALIVIGDNIAIPAEPRSQVRVEILTLFQDLEAVHKSPNVTLIQLKDHFWKVMDDSYPQDLQLLLSDCTNCCSTRNLFYLARIAQNILQTSIDLCILYVSVQPKEVTEKFLMMFHEVWNVCYPDRHTNIPKDTDTEDRENLSPCLRNFDEDDRAPTPISDDETDGPKMIVNKVVDDGKRETASNPNNSDLSDRENNHKISQTVGVKVNSNDNSTKNSDTKIRKSSQFLNYFERILCPRNIGLLMGDDDSSCDVWESLGNFLLFILHNNYVSEESLTEQCLAVYNKRLPKAIQENLSTCMRVVSSNWSKCSVGKFTLILDFMAEFATDMDYDSS